MKLKDMFEIVPDCFEVKLLFSELALNGTKDSMDIMLSDDIMSSDVGNIEARDNVLWVWVE